MMPLTLLMEMIVNMNGEKFTENISVISEGIRVVGKGSWKEREVGKL